MQPMLLCWSVLTPGHPSLELHLRITKHKDRLFSVWTENDKYIQDMNSRNLTYTLGHNQFSAMTSEEFSGYLGFGGERTIVDKIKNIRDKAQEVKCILDCVKDEELTNLDKVGCTKQCLSQELESDIPSEIDWVAKGAVTPVKNQGQCGSCWSFSTTGALEGAYYIKYGNLQSFSEQQLVDCDNFKHGGKDHGCNGGLMDNTFKWIEKNDGLCTESDYPYTSGETPLELVKHHAMLTKKVISKVSLMCLLPLMKI